MSWVEKFLKINKRGTSIRNLRVCDLGVFKVISSVPTYLQNPEVTRERNIFGRADSVVFLR